MYIKCPKCGFEAEMPDEYIGIDIICPKCSTTFTSPKKPQISTTLDDHGIVMLAATNLMEIKEQLNAINKKLDSLEDTKKVVTRIRGDVMGILWIFIIAIIIIVFATCAASSR